MIRRPPRSTPFPYPPLSDLLPSGRGLSSRSRTAAITAAPSASFPTAAGTAARCQPGWSCKKSKRSEEHTSEFQSRQYLVCRLLLEKKQQYPQPNLHSQLILT